ncbi:MAG: hypothetical protein OEQ47_03780, partial [Acidimicrobiia bacterium]|nr:hypothetical protein [Acidimicrobiia bacterium]
MTLRTIERAGPRTAIAEPSSDLRLFLWLAFGVTFLATAPIVASYQGWITSEIGTGGHAVGALGPMVAALVIARRSPGATDHLRSGLVRWRVSGWYYLAALSPLIFLAPAAVITR